jgi:N-acetylglucosaminyldiphosphoundecaprenol N-acetyl-beta-D-mannosaminyltransferase
MTELQSKPLLNCRVDIVEDYSRYLADQITLGKGQFVVTINPEIIMQARSNESFANIINNADLIIPDGIGITLHYLLRRQKVPKRAGIEVTHKLLKILNQTSNNKVTIIGSTNDNITKAKSNLSKEFPNLIIESFDGYFDNDKETEILSRLQADQPNLILVGLGSPKQEQWIYTNKHLCPNSIWIGVGGSFDIWSGSKKRAPRLMISLGLEWLYRLYQEPRRLSRMLVLPWFLWLSVRDLFIRK